jgi:spermidine synthase
MPDTTNLAHHAKPFVYESLTSKALHFSISAIQSRMTLRDPYALDLEYTRTMMGFLLFNPEPRQIVMIGLGGGSLAKFCYHHLPRASVQVAEINPHVIALREEFYVPSDDERFRVIRTDGAQFVRHRVVRPDVLVVDGFDTDGQPPRLASQRFYDDCHEMLQPDGILVVNLHYGHRQRDAFIERIRRSFDDAVLVVDDGDLSNSIVFACKGHALSRPKVDAALAQISQSARDQLAASFEMILRELAASRQGGDRRPGSSSKP